MILLLLCLAGLLMIIGAKDLANKAIKAVAGLCLIVTFAPAAAVWFARDPMIRAALITLSTLLIVAGGLLVAAKLLARPSERTLQRPSLRERARLVEPERLAEPEPRARRTGSGDDLGLFGGEDDHEGT